MRLTGNLKPLFLIAARTRSRDSFTAVSGSPTISKAGRPLEMLIYTLTGYPPTPLTPRLLTQENMTFPLFFDRGYRDMQFIQLFLFHRRGRSHHDVLRTLVHRERDNLADAVFAG